VIKAVVAHHLAMPLDAFQRLVIAPASVTVLHLPVARRTRCCSRATTPDRR
jgi:hypothetical protein